MSPDKEVSFQSFRGSIKPVLWPATAKSVAGKNNKRGGWKLLQSLNRKGQLITSLTGAEERFLSSLNCDGRVQRKDTPLPENKKEDTRDRRQTAASRLRLRDSIAATSVAGKLTPKEASFLNKLVDSPDVDEACLDTCCQVLEKDPLYRVVVDDDDTKEKKEKEREENRQETKIGGRRQSLLTDASFRTELWRELQKEEDQRSYSSQQTLTFHSVRSLKDARAHRTRNNAEKQKEDKEEAEENSSPQQKAWDAFVHKFQTMFAHQDDGDSKELDENDDDDLVDEGEEPLTICVLATSVQDLIGQQPPVLSPAIMDALRPHLPFAVQHDNFWLKYSLVRDGACMRTLLNNVRSSARTILAIETDKGDVFGSFTSSPWRPYGKGYYGSGEAFLWRLSKSRYTPCDSVHKQIELENDVEVFPWSGHNRNIQCSVRTDSELIVGGGGADDSPEDDRGCGIGLTVTRDLERGFSDKCLTFESPPLMTRDKDMFYITNLEVWTLTPVDSLDMAEKLELSRQFVFDHGNFLEQ
jgi:hypothetical protein